MTLEDFNTIAAMRAVHGSVVLEDFNTIAAMRAVHGSVVRFT